MAGPRDSVEARHFKLALARLPARMRGALGLFREITGFTAVASLGSAVDEDIRTGTLVPPVHPRCASQLKKIGQTTPCEDQWRKHIRAGRRSHAAQSHTCPLGLRCSCVPIHYGETLVGVAKLVTNREIPARRFSSAGRTLELAISQVCQDFRVSALSDEVQTLRHGMAELKSLRNVARSIPVSRNAPAPSMMENVQIASAGSLVDRALDYIGGHYLETGLSLPAVSRALGVNGKYLTRLFSQVVGQRMRAYILELRVQHACRLLLDTDTPIKQISYESGFSRPDGFRRAFQEHVGITPAAYRRIFTAS